MVNVCALRRIEKENREKQFHKSEFRREGVKLKKTKMSWMQMLKAGMQRAFFFYPCQKPSNKVTSLVCSLWPCERKTHHLERLSTLQILWNPLKTLRNLWTVVHQYYYLLTSPPKVLPKMIKSHLIGLDFHWNLIEKPKPKTAQLWLLNSQYPEEQQ